MVIDFIDEAETEAKRFLYRIKLFKQRLYSDQEFKKYYGITGFKETAALKRASLDLTRSLSRMRGNV